MKYRKKPVVIEAVPVRDLLDAAEGNWKALPAWVKESYETGDVVFHPHIVDIKTLEGWMAALETDWMIRGIKGELYPCKPDIFAATYDKVEDQ